MSVIALCYGTWTTTDKCYDNFGSDEANKRTNEKVCGTNSTGCEKVVHTNGTVYRNCTHITCVSGLDITHGGFRHCCQTNLCNGAIDNVKIQVPFMIMLGIASILVKNIF